MHDRILTLEEAAEFARVSPDTIRSLLESQEVAGRILDGEWRTTGRALLDFIDGAGKGMDCCCCCPTGPDGKPCCSGRPGCC